MAAPTPRTLIRDAKRLFRSDAVPDSLAFFSDLSPLNQRLFIVELWEALSKASINGRQEDERALLEMLEGWEATAEIERHPEIMAEIRRPKEYVPIDFGRLGSE